MFREGIMENIDWKGMAKLIVKLVNNMSNEEYKKLQSFALDYTVKNYQPDKWYLTIGEDSYRVGYIFLRDLYLVYGADGKMVTEVRPKKIDDPIEEK